MKPLTQQLKLSFALTLFSTLIITLNPAMANTDMKAMAEVQRARAKNKENVDHSKHLMPVDESQKFRGVFYGYLPCKTCAGIKMTLSLKNKKNYLLVTQYAQASNREYYEKGKYTWDEKSRIVTLVSRKDSSVRKLQIKNEGALIVLSPEGSPMKGSQDKYTLLRTDMRKSRELHIH